VSLLKLVFFCLLAFVAPVYGQPHSMQPVPGSRDMGVAADGMVGIVVNQTITANGYEFYRIFSILWSEDPDSRNYSLSIKERLSKRYGNRVDVYLGQKLVYSAVLPLKYDGLQTLCEKAVEDTQTNIASLSIQASDDTDIVREEM
jgi:hypothetical protein